MVFLHFSHFIKHYNILIDNWNSCQHVTSSSGTFSSILEPVARSTNNMNSGKATNQDKTTSTLLISAKPDQFIWVDFAKLDGNQRTKVKVLPNK